MWDTDRHTDNPVGDLSHDDSRSINVSQTGSFGNLEGVGSGETMVGETQLSRGELKQVVNEVIS